MNLEPRRRSGTVAAGAPATTPRLLHPAWQLLSVVLRLLIVAAIIPTNADPDLWGNLRFGLDIISGQRVGVDVYAFTRDLPWINHEWLAQATMAAAFRMGGSAGLVLLKSAIVGAALWLIGGAFAGSVPLIPEAAAGLALWGALPITITVRAQLWTFLGLAILCRLLRSSWRARWLIPFLLLVWANSHIGWTIGLGVLGTWALGAAWRSDRSDRVRWCVLCGASLAATLANPYGFRLWMFALNVAHMSRQIQEWQPLWTSPVVNWIPWTISVVLVAILFRQNLWTRPERLILLAGFAYAGARVLKFSPLFVEMTVLLLVPTIKERFVGTRDARRSIPVAARLINWAAIAVVVINGAIVAWPSFTCLHAADWRPDPTAARALSDARPSGRLAVWFDWGEYALWQFGPQLRVSFDPRYDLIYSPATIHEQQSVADGLPAGFAFLERERPEYVWYPQSKQALKRWLPDHGYRIDLSTDASFVGVREDLRPVQQPMTPQTPGCFPAP